MITLEPITDANRDAIVALRTSPDQERFVSTVAGSMAEAIEEAGAGAVQRGIYDGDTPVGFVMWAEEVGGDEYVPYYLWKLLIDERYQRRGYGSATIDQVAARFRAAGAEVLTTSAGQGDGSPIPFYERYGFERTGEVLDDEVLLRLRL